ncbi:MAG: hypothetical protein R3B60_02300 [Candidatus Paceibacterota bacterium]
MQNGRITKNEVIYLLNAIATYYGGLLQIQENNVLLDNTHIGEITINGRHNHDNLIYFWQKILLKVIQELEGEDTQSLALYSLKETSAEIWTYDCHIFFCNLIEHEFGK